MERVRVSSIHPHQKKKGFRLIWRPIELMAMAQHTQHSLIQDLLTYLFSLSLISLRFKKELQAGWVGGCYEEAHSFDSIPFLT